MFIILLKLWYNYTDDSLNKNYRFNTADVDEWVRIYGAFCEQEMI